MIKQFRVHNPDSTCEVPVPWPRAAVLRGSVGSLELREDPLDASRGTLSAPWSIDQQTFEHLVEYFDNRDDYTVEIEEWLELDEDSWRRFERDSSSTSSAQSLAEKPDVIIERVSIHREDGSEFQVYSTGHILRTVVVDELSAPAIARCLSRAFGTPVTADVRERHESPQNTSAA